MKDSELQEWIGRSQVDEDRASAGELRRLAVLLDLEPAVHGSVPQGWHCAFFPPLALQRSLGVDGHPKVGEFLPPIPFPRRMFAGRSMTFFAPIPLDAILTRTSTIRAITRKEGRSGPLIIVKVEHSIAAAGCEALREVHNIFYLPAAEGSDRAAATALPPELPEAQLTERFDATSALLFRYSAIGYNAHRIHYDLPYARFEGHPGLVVNGGLLALKLLELAKRRGGRELASFEVRHRRPIYSDTTIELRATGDDEIRLWALDENGMIAAEGIAVANA